MDILHITVFKQETINGITKGYGINPNGFYLDLTLGYGGHSARILPHLTTGWLYAFDHDIDAIEYSSKRLSQISDRFTLFHDNFKNISILNSYGITFDGIIMDLGVSSPQLDHAHRGFSFKQDAPLDMRMDQRNNLTAFDVVNTYSSDRLRNILRDLGEERYASRIASRIVERRQISPIQTTCQLADIILSAIPRSARNKDSHPCQRSFMAIRIHVNEELDILEQSVKTAVNLLSPGGRIGIITFHSLEDRIIKNTLTELGLGCTCPRQFPVCVCHKTPLLKIVTKKPIIPSERQILENSRAKSAKLRLAERVV